MDISLILNQTRDFLFQVWVLLIQTWWVWLPLALFFILAELWLGYVRKKFLSGIDWVLLEIKFPPEVERTPKAMENTFAGLHAIQTNYDFIDRWLNGKVPLWLSLEMVSIEGKTQFFIYSPASFKNLVEAHIYAQFPHAEINQIDDYVKNMPEDLPKADWDLWGTELMLVKEDAYPIRTHVYFESGDEETQVDPLSAMTEVFSKLDLGEQLWVQIIIKPVDDEWKKEGEKVIAKLIGKKIQSKQNIIEQIFSAIYNVLDLILDVLYVHKFFGVDLAAAEPKKEERVPENLLQFLTPGQKDVVKAIEDNISKIGFQTGIRFIYLAKPSVLNRANVSSILGVFKQFNTQHLNGFKSNSEASTSSGRIFTKLKEYLKKQKIFLSYKFRSMTMKPFIFNIEELATIYHFPGRIAAAPMLPRIQSKKAEPPSTLPIG